ncbi:MAG: DUF933 domain-containing protein [Pirellulales bacterium]|nr:DUF933 domain-containing protein [Pirellulales bacterium]
MKIGIVGYQGTGKSTFFSWLTEVETDPAKGHLSQTAVCLIPDDRIDALCEVYNPKKVTTAGLELVDTPGLARDGEGNANRLATIRESDCLVLIVPAFAGASAANELSSLEADLALADLEIVTKRIEKLRESVKKPRPNREQEQKELASLEPIVQRLEAGDALAELQLEEEQKKAIRSFRLFAEKPKLVVANIADNVEGAEVSKEIESQGYAVLAAPLSLELELAGMPEDDRAEFEQDLQLTTPRRDEFIKALLRASRQQLYFTAGEKEVRSWLLPEGGTALEAADNVHSDLAKGFIRAEVMRSEDLIRLGSEREIKANNLMRQEHREYVVQDGDILLIRHN